MPLISLDLLPSNLLTAQPVAAQEPIIMGMPQSYFLLMCLLITIIMIMGFVLVWYWLKMGPCRAYFGAAVFGSGEIGLLCRGSGRASFINTRYVNGIFNAIGIPLSWIQRSFESYRFGACSMKILCDTTGIATEPMVQQAIKEFVINHNDRELRREAAYAKADKYYSPQLITDYEDLYQYIIEGKDLNGNAVDIPPEIKIHAVFEVSIDKVQRFLAHIGPGDLEGHLAVRIAEDKEAGDQKDKVPGWMWIVIIIFIAFGALFTAANYFKK